MCPQTSGEAAPRTTFWRRSWGALCGSRLGLALSLVFALAPACAVVKPYQREQLAERCMAPGLGDSAELKFRSHWEGSRHGGEGGFSYASGGCGCN